MPTFAVMMIMITADIGTIEIQAQNMIIAAIIKMTTIMISRLAVTGPGKIRLATYSVTVYLSSKIMYALTIIMLLNLLTWNVRGIMSSAFTLSQLLSCYNTDIALITEHKLMPHSKCFFDNIHPSYASAVKISQQINPYSRASCGKAGVAIMYKKGIDCYISEIDTIMSDRILGIELKNSQIASTLSFAYICLQMEMNKTILKFLLNYKH